MSESGPEPKPYSKVYWERVFATLRSEVRGGTLPSVSEIAHESSSPFRVLIGTMISLRTKDDVTLAASNRLFAVADTPATIAELDESRIAKLIYPAGFYRTKAHNILLVSRIIRDDYNEVVPDAIGKLVDLPGVGRKTANLVLNLGFGIPAICVDTHVHRISNRFGWVSTKTPDKTEIALSDILPEEHWIEINELLVGYGQKTCTPISPFCSRCPFGPQARAGTGQTELCPQIGVDRSR